MSYPNTGPGETALTLARPGVGRLVGHLQISPLIELYAGGQWTAAASPILGGPGGLSGVSCASADECWAVGHSGFEPTDQPLIEEELAGSWSVVSSPHIDASNGAALLSIACPQPASCWAVGGTLPGVLIAESTS
jgi:hypothetical protein